MDNLTVFGEARLAAAGLAPEERRAPDLVPVAGILDGVEEFDAAFFGMSPEEARLTRPAHRLFPMCCHQALEDGGCAATELGTRVGVVAGSGRTCTTVSGRPWPTPRPPTPRPPTPRPACRAPSDSSPTPSPPASPTASA
ncbi:beta-ketoacyl synthase N-terminal-like domain-containing protein [Streptomyces cinereospinus]|uniref:Beta-ketoacyl synthase N-terminal-like domain-containing protein n=1 Tax=Streptomyces cinereospinus TaxID=285561 RepID=A0ABV5N5Q5_9ACTN